MILGVGIDYTDLRDKVGEWNSTSKHEKGLSHGFRGEALAAARVLSTMTLTSKTEDCDRTYTKLFRELGNCDEKIHCNMTTASNSLILHSGTQVTIWQLFDRLPARRKSIQPHVEILRIKEFVQRMSMLYHDVGWLLINATTKKVLMKLVPEASVCARFSSFHGQEIQNKMKVRQSR